MLDEYAAAVKNLDFSAYDQAFRTNPNNYHTDLIGDPMKNWAMAGASVEELLGELKCRGISLNNVAAAQPLIGPKYERRPGGLYESMLQPLVPYGLRGIIWYQGETDGDTHPELYRTLFPALIADWRACWDEELPFLFVQLAPLDHWLQCDGTPYAAIRAAQQHTVDTVTHTGMAVITDAGMRWDIHPKAKRPVGERLALLAQSVSYGEDILCEAPTLSAVWPEEGKLTLNFQNAGEGLHLGYMSPYGEALPGGRLTALTITQNGKSVDTSALSAQATGNTIILTGSSLHAGPTEVGIAQGAWYQVNLYNSAGLPARPAVLHG